MKKGHKKRKKTHFFKMAFLKKKGLFLDIENLAPLILHSLHLMRESVKASFGWVSGVQAELLKKSAPACTETRV